MNDKAIDIYKINKGILGVINLNNMIPAPMECLTEVLKTITDKTYKILLEKQITYINDNKKELLKKVNQFQLRYRKGHLSETIINRCCNFIVLEEKCKKWKMI